MIIQVRKSETAISGSNKELQLLSTEFEQCHCVKLPNFLDKELLQYIQCRIEKSGFYEENYRASGQDNPISRIEDKITESILKFLINDQALFNFIQRITGCPQIGSFSGRVYKMSPDTGHRDSWHDDMLDNRMITLSINLSTDIYSGGRLQIKDCHFEKIIKEVANTGFGDAVIFRIAPYLKHRLTEVTGTVSRIFCAGWFRSKPAYKPIFNFYSSKDLRDKKPNNRIDISKCSTVTKAKDLFYKVVNKRLTVFNPINNICYGLDEIGTKIFDLFNTPKKVSEIIDIILCEYNVDTKTCEENLLCLLKELVINKLIFIDNQNKRLECNELQLAGR